jgi:hypothetical protein
VRPVLRRTFCVPLLDIDALGWELGNLLAKICKPLIDAPFFRDSICRSDHHVGFCFRNQFSQALGERRLKTF